MTILYYRSPQKCAWLNAGNKNNKTHARYINQNEAIDATKKRQKKHRAYTQGREDTSARRAREEGEYTKQKHDQVHY